MEPNINPVKQTVSQNVQSENPSNKSGVGFILLGILLAPLVLFWPTEMLFSIIMPILSPKLPSDSMDGFLLGGILSTLIAPIFLSALYGFRERGSTIARGIFYFLTILIIGFFSLLYFGGHA